jgi:hypothetical protein
VPSLGSTDLGSLISGLDSLRERALALMQADPHAPVPKEEAGFFNALVDGCVAHLAGDEAAAEARRIGDGEDVAELHRRAGVLEHALELRLAEIRTGRRRPGDGT